MMNFEYRTGPDFGKDSPSYPETVVPTWYRDAKLGFFIHWGIYCVPAWAPVRPAGQIPAEDAYKYTSYAEWYANAVRIVGGPTWQHHQKHYGPGTSYEDLADSWDIGDFSATSLVDELVASGARYIVPTTKHHDGFCLWGTKTTGFNATRRGPRRDLIGELHDAARRADCRFGVYFSGALDWHVSEFPPIESDTNLFRFRRDDEYFARYSAAQLEELIERFSPDLLWNDIEWSDGGKGNQDYAVAAIMRRYFERIPSGVVNDRWGVPYHGFLTREYDNVDAIIDEPWESTRGIGLSFGYNQNEDEDESLSLSGSDLIRMLIDVVSKNGNLLINVGPRPDGSLSEIHRRTIAELGQWLKLNGESIYATRPWVRPNEPTGAPVAYTKAGEVVYLHALAPQTGEVELPTELADASHLTWLGGGEATAVQGRVEIPDALRGTAAAVLTLRR